MGSKPEKDKVDKQDKKRLKAEYKLEKKRLKAQQNLATVPGSTSRTEFSKEHAGSLTAREPGRIQQPLEKVPWYKDSGWIRALVGIASLIVAIIAILISLYL
jgi:hypothetical protein